MSREQLQASVTALYQDVFDSGNCLAVDPHYHPDVICYFNNLELTLENLKAAMAKFVSLHVDIKTEIKHLLVDGDRTFARLERSATCKETNQRSTTHLMVLKEFKDDKVAKVWFMVDNDVVRSIWSEKSTSASCAIA